MKHTKEELYEMIEDAERFHEEFKKEFEEKYGLGDFSYETDKEGIKDLEKTLIRNNYSFIKPNKEYIVLDATQQGGLQNVKVYKDTAKEDNYIVHCVFRKE